MEAVGTGRGNAGARSEDELEPETEPEPEYEDEPEPGNESAVEPEVAAGSQSEWPSEPGGLAGISGGGGGKRQISITHT